MNKTEKILACEGHIKRESIKTIVGCTEQLVYMVLNSRLSKEDYKPKHRGRVVVKKQQLKPKLKTELKKDMKVLIYGSSIVWNVTFVGKEITRLKNGYDNKSVTHDKISKVLS